MRNILLILLCCGSCAQAVSRPVDSLTLTISAEVVVAACTVWVENSAGVTSGEIVLEPVTLSALHNASSAVGKTAFKVGFQCSMSDRDDMLEFGDASTMFVRFTAKGEVDSATQILKNSRQENANGAKNVGFLIKDDQDNVVKFGANTDTANFLGYDDITKEYCKHISPEYQADIPDSYDAQCSSHSFNYSVEYAAYGDSPGAGLVDADATVTVDWQ